jgi:cyclic pyranopterin phosphate synthase
MTRTPGCFDLLVRGVEAWRARGLPMDGDVLVYASTVDELPETVRVFAGLGVQRFNLWLFSAAASAAGPGGAGDLAHEMPRMRDVMPRVEQVLAAGLSTRPDFLTSLHTPPCTVTPAAAACLFEARRLELLVANPGGYSFMLEESPIEGGHYLERCAGCAMRARCGGLRREYLAVHGDAEFQPVAPGAERTLPVLRDVVGGS